MDNESMCGIAGIHSFDGSRVDETLLKSMCDSIEHRGPDDWGTHVEPGVGLGNRRLSIIDLQGGHQPISNGDDSLWVAYNGELYNYRELRDSLSAGYDFKTQSDTEVVLAAYAKWGVDCVKRFNGIFAFSIWDRERRQLFLARDHLGVKPLYFHQGAGRLLFASEIKALLRDVTVPRRVDLRSLDLFLTYRYVPSPSTLLEGVYKLPPAHRLVCRNGDVNVDCYWEYVPTVTDSIGEADAVEELAFRFEAAVHRQMVSDVPVGLMLSGGIDSGGVLAVMSKYASNPVQTFTAGFAGESDANELNEAQETARLFGAEHRDVRIEAPDYPECLSKVLWHLEEPLSTTSILPFFYVSELAAQHVKVVLTGQGADEPFAGYNRYRGEKLGGLLRKFPPAIQSGLSKATMRIPHRSEQFRRAARALTVDNPLERFVEVYAVLAKPERQQLYRADVAAAVREHDPADAIAALRLRVEHLDSLSQMLYVDTRVWLPDDLLLYGDKLSMAHSLEARVPFLDVEFIEFVETLPSRLKLKGMTGKYIHKKAMAKWLPPQIIKRPKKGFATPIDQWFQNELADYLRQTLLDSGAACLHYFELDEVKRMIDKHVSGERELQRQLFALLTFELWHRAFVKG